MAISNTIPRQINYIIDQLKSASFAQSIANRLVSQIISDIDAGVDYNGKPFEPLSETTVLGKGSDQFLRDTGELVAGISGTGLSNRVLLASNADHSNYINSGTRNMPQRQFMPLDGDDVSNKFEDIIQEELDAIINKANIF